MRRVRFTGQTYKSGVSGQQPEYLGLSVQTLNAPFPVYHNQSDTHENFADSFNSLNKYTINSPDPAASANNFINDIPEIPQSALDQYVPWNSDDQRFHYTLPSTSDIPFIQQVCLSGSEPEIMGPTSVSYLNPENRLTHFPVDNPEDLRPTAVVNPLSLNQTSKIQGIVDYSPIVMHNKELHNNPAFPGNQRGLQRKSHKNDSSYAERRSLYKVRQSMCKKMRYKNDPAFAERRKKYQREYQRRRRQDPVYLKNHRLRQRELRKDPAYSEREKALDRQRHRNSAYLKRKKSAAHLAKIKPCAASDNTGLQ